MKTLIETVLGGIEVYRSEKATFSLSREIFFLIDDIWVAVMEGDPGLERTYNHIAFKISDTDLPKYLSKINALGLEVCESRSRVKGEGRSIYFYDYDNHLFELHTGTLEERLILYGTKLNMQNPQ
jgi:catechol 2,3-dioxygenase-like lactoylglutathione lyase family enzyme